MSNTIRAALEQLLHDLIEGKVLDGAIAAAEQALAEDLVGPTQKEAVDLYSEVMAAHDCQTFGEMAEHVARAVLARWGHPTAPPAPEAGEQHVSQPYKLPEPGDDPSA